MFLQDLTPDQQRTFFRAAGLVIAADGKHEQAEVELLEAAQSETALGDVPAPAESVGELLEDLLRQLRAFLVRIEGCTPTVAIRPEPALES